MLIKRVMRKLFTMANGLTVFYMSPCMEKLRFRFLTFTEHILRQFFLKKSQGIIIPFIEYVQVKVVIPRDKTLVSNGPEKSTSTNEIRDFMRFKNISNYNSHFQKALLYLFYQFFSIRNLFHMSLFVFHIISSLNSRHQSYQG